MFIWVNVRKFIVILERILDKLLCGKRKLIVDFGFRLGIVGN